MDTTSRPGPATLRDPVLTTTGTAPAGHRTLDVVIPVYNEERDLESAVRRLRGYLDGGFPFSARITIADNASTDATPLIARRLAAELGDVRVVRLDRKGRGHALREAWLSADADVLAYMDVDLSTDLSALLPLVAPLVSGHSHLAIGSRLTPASRVVRGPKREFISRSYNLLLHGTLSAGFSDAQCGFKAIRSEVARQLVPLVQDNAWFFDTELLVLAERAGLRIHEVPVDWVDDPESSVDIRATVLADLAGIARLGRALRSGRLPLAAVRAQLPLVGDRERPTTLLGQVVRFSVVGILSTIAYALLYLALRNDVGAQTANLVALLVTAVLNTAANRRLTFGVRGAAGATRHQAQGLVVFALAWALTAGSLGLVHALAPGAPHLVELAALVLANLVGTLLRFLLLRHWVFASRPSARPTTSAPEGIDR